MNIRPLMQNGAFMKMTSFVKNAFVKSGEVRKISPLFFLVAGGAIAAGALTSCAPSMPKTKGLSYLSVGALNIPVSHIEVHVTPGTCEGVGITSVSLIDMTKQWANEHLLAAGGRNRLKLIIEQALVQEESLPVDSSPVGWFKVENTDRYPGKLSVRVELVTPMGQLLGQVRITVSSEKYVPENYTIPERRALLISLYEDLINRLTLEADKAIPEMIRQSRGE